MSNSVKRACQLLTVLAGHETTGLRNTDLSKCLNVSPATITNDLNVLKDAGFVEEISHLSKRWRLAPKILQLALAYQRHVGQAKHRIDEFEQRVTRQP